MQCKTFILFFYAAVVSFSNKHKIGWPVWSYVFKFSPTGDWSHRNGIKTYLSHLVLGMVVRVVRFLIYRSGSLSSHLSSCTSSSLLLMEVCVRNTLRYAHLTIQKTACLSVHKSKCSWWSVCLAAKPVSGTHDHSVGTITLIVMVRRSLWRQKGCVLCPACWYSSSSSSSFSSSSFPMPCYLPVAGSSVHLLNPFLSFANLSISLIVFPFSLPNSSTTSSHVSLGRPLPLFPIGLAPNVCLGFLSSATLGIFQTYVLIVTAVFVRYI